MIIAAAILYNGSLWTLPKPARHCDILTYMIECGVSTPIAGDDQGFITDEIKFIDRKQAVSHAKACGQIVEPKFQQNALFSEDLW